MEEDEKRLKNIWNCMRQRCNNPNNTATRWYHDRGVRLCEKWERDFASFKKWALKNGYAPGLSIDRIDPDGNYEPKNCRWIPLNENRARARKRAKGDKRGVRVSKRGKYQVWYVYYPGGWAFVEKTGLSYHEAKKYSNEWAKKDDEERHRAGWEPCLAGMVVVKPGKEERRLTPGSLVLNANARKGGNANGTEKN